VGRCALSIPKASVQRIDLPLSRYFRPLLTIKRCRMSLFGSTRIEISARCHSHTEKTLPSGLPWTVPYPTLRPTGPIPNHAKHLSPVKGAFLGSKSGHIINPHHTIIHQLLEKRTTSNICQYKPRFNVSVGF
jgi:hypothetical protein